MRYLDEDERLPDEVLEAMAEAFEEIGLDGEAQKIYDELQSRDELRRNV